MTDTRSDLIERKIDRKIADEIIVSRVAGGVDIQRLGEMMEAAKLMSLSGSMVPAFLRENPGGCFGICWKALAWGFDAFSVASMAYEVEKSVKGSSAKEKTVAFMSQLIHAVIEARAPIKKRLEVRYEGEGDDRVCIVSGTFIGEDKPREHKSPRLADRRPKARGRDTRDPRDPQGVLDDDAPGPGSPLWRSKPDVQLFYDTSRDWCRIYCPDVLLGVYSKEEMAEAGFGPVIDNVPDDDGGLSTRLSASAAARAGFPAAQVAEEVDGAVSRRDDPREDGNGEAGEGPPDGDPDDGILAAGPTRKGRPRAPRGRRSTPK